MNNRNGVARYREWAENGYVQRTEGNIVDYAAVKGVIYHLQEKCFIHSVAHDQWNAWETNSELYETVAGNDPLCRDYTYLGNPTKRLEMMVIAAKVGLDANLLFMWNFRNPCFGKERRH